MGASDCSSGFSRLSGVDECLVVLGPRRAIWAGEVEQRKKVERWTGDVRAGVGPHKKALLSRQLSQAYASK